MSLKTSIDSIVREYLANNVDIDWNKFQNINRALYADVYYGPGHEMLKEDRFEIYGTGWDFVDAMNELRDILDDVPNELYVNVFTDEVVELNSQSEPAIESSPSDWYRVDVYPVIMNKEIYRLI